MNLKIVRKNRTAFGLFRRVWISSLADAAHCICLAIELASPPPSLATVEFVSRRCSLHLPDRTRAHTSVPGDGHTSTWSEQNFLLPSKIILKFICYFCRILNTCKWQNMKKWTLCNTFLYSISFTNGRTVLSLQGKLFSELVRITAR